MVVQASAVPPRTRRLYRRDALRRCHGRGAELGWTGASAASCCRSITKRRARLIHGAPMMAMTSCISGHAGPCWDRQAWPLLPHQHAGPCHACRWEGRVRPISPCAASRAPLTSSRRADRTGRRAPAQRDAWSSASAVASMRGAREQ